MIYDIDLVYAVYANGKYICTIGGQDATYDNVQWWILSEFIQKFEGETPTVEEIEKGLEEIPYFFVASTSERAYKNKRKLDLVLKTIDFPYVPICEFDETGDYACFNVTKKGEKFFGQYENEEEVWEIGYVYFRKEEILHKKSGTFEEFRLINALMDYCILCADDNTFILNNHLVLRLNMA